MSKSQNSDSLYLVFLQFMQKEGAPPNLIKEYANFLESSSKLKKHITLEGDYAPASLTEARVQNQHMGNNQQKLLDLFTDLIQQQDQGGLLQQQEKYQNLERRIKKVFLNYLANLQEENAPNQRQLMLKKKHKFQPRDRSPQFPIYNFVHFKKLKNILAHAFSQSSGNVNAENEEPFIPVDSLNYDKSGKVLFSADSEGLIKIFSSETGLLLHTLRGHTKSINVLEVSPCNKYLVSCSQDATARVWDFINCKPIAVFKSDVEDPIGVANWLEKNGELFLVICSDKGMVYIYREQDFKDNQGYLNPQQECLSLKMPWKNRYINGKLVIQEKNEVHDIQFHPKGYLTISLESGEIYIYEELQNFHNKNHNLRHQQKYNHIILDDHLDYCNRIQWNPQGTLLISASNDGTCKFWSWDPKNLELNRDKKPYYEIQLSDEQLNEKSDKQHKRTFYSSMCTVIAFSKSGEYAISAFHKQPKKPPQDQPCIIVSFIFVYSVKKNKILRVLDSKTTPLKFEDFIWIIEPHPIREEIILTADYSGQIAIWDIKEGIMLNAFQEKGYAMNWPNLDLPILDARFSPNGQQFTVCSFFGTLSIYGLGNSDFYKICPTEQFFASDYDPMAVDENLRVTSVEVDAFEIHDMERGRICNQEREPYTFEYQNNMASLNLNYYFNTLLTTYRQPLLESGRNYDREQQEYFQLMIKEIERCKKKDEVIQNQFMHEKLTKKSYLLQVSNQIRQRCQLQLNDFQINTKIKMQKDDIYQLDQQIQMEQIQIQQENNQEQGRGRGGGRGRGRLRRMGQQNQNQIQDQNMQPPQSSNNPQQQQQNVQSNRLSRNERVREFESQRQRSMQQLYDQYGQMDDQNDETFQTSRQNRRLNRQNTTANTTNTTNTRRSRRIIDSDSDNDNDINNDNKKLKRLQSNNLEDEYEEEEQKQEIYNSDKDILNSAFNSDISEEIIPKKRRGRRTKIDDDEDDEEEYNHRKQNNTRSRRRKTREKNKRKKKINYNEDYDEDFDDEEDEYISSQNILDEIDAMEDEESQQSLSQELKKKRNRLSKKRIIDSDSESQQQQLIEEEEQEQEIPENKNQENSDQVSQQTLSKKRKQNRAIYSDSENEAEEEKVTKKIKTDENQFCSRCNNPRPEIQCSVCHKHFHEKPCSQKRGIYNQQTHKFICFSCQAKKDLHIKRDDTPKQKCQRSYLNSSLHNQFKYLPQVGDKAYFIVQGYECFLQKYFEILNVKKLNEFYIQNQQQQNNNFDIILPQENYFNLNFPTLVEIQDISYEFPHIHKKSLLETFPKPPIFMQLTLQVLPDQQYTPMQIQDPSKLDLQAQKFTLFYTLPEKFSQNFLIPEQLYKNTFEPNPYKIFKPNTVFKVTGEDEKPTEILIIEHSDQERETYPDSDYLKILVKDKHPSKAHENVPYRVSPWDIIYPNFLHLYLGEVFSQQDMITIQDYMTNLRKFRPDQYEIFGEPVDTKEYKDYLHFIQVPMDLTLIETKLENLYYRSKKQIVHDINNLEQNAFKFNQEGSDICKMATSLKTILIKILDNYDNYDYLFPQLFSNVKDYNTYMKQKHQTQNVGKQKHHSVLFKQEQEQQQSQSQEQNTREQIQPKQADQQQQQQQQGSKRSTRGHSANYAQFFDENLEKKHHKRKTHKRTTQQHKQDQEEEQQEDLQDTKIQIQQSQIQQNNNDFNNTPVQEKQPPQNRSHSQKQNSSNGDITNVLAQRLNNLSTFTVSNDYNNEDQNNIQQEGDQNIQNTFQNMIDNVEDIDVRKEQNKLYRKEKSLSSDFSEEMDDDDDEEEVDHNDFQMEFDSPEQQKKKSRRTSSSNKRKTRRNY